jgi:nitrile hydratase accessory protein
MSLPDTGPAAPPMANGELVFEAPWQGRVFGMAEALASADVFPWSEFQSALIEKIAAWEAHGADEPYQYYDHFLAALESVLVARDIVSEGDLATRLHVLEARPHGHDH